MNNDTKEAAAVIGIIATLIGIVASIIAGMANSVRMASDWENSPNNPLNQPKLAWHATRFNHPTPVDGMYRSEIDIYVQNDGRLMVEHVGVLIDTLTDDPCISCDGGESSKAAGGNWLVKIPKLTARNSVRILVTEWLREFPKPILSESNEFGTAGTVEKVTYEKGPIECNKDKCRVYFHKLEPIPKQSPTLIAEDNKPGRPTPVPDPKLQQRGGVSPTPRDVPKERKPNIPAPSPKASPPIAHSVPRPAEPRFESPRPETPVPVQPLPYVVQGVLPQSKHTCGCGKPNCRCGANCKCLKTVIVVPRNRR